MEETVAFAEAVSVTKKSLYLEGKWRRGTRLRYQGQNVPCPRTSIQIDLSMTNPNQARETKS
jgi:hypothetical protein